MGENLHQRYAQRQAIARAAKEAGARDIMRVVASSELAVFKGQAISEVISLLVKNQPSLFYPARPPIEFRQTTPRKSAPPRTSRPKRQVFDDGTR